METWNIVISLKVLLVCMKDTAICPRQLDFQNEFPINSYIIHDIEYETIGSSVQAILKEHL